ncbi:MAG: ribosome small subunit-dependent GTPase A [bacterium]
MLSKTSTNPQLGVIVRVEGHKRLVQLNSKKQVLAIVRGRRLRPYAGDQVELSSQSDGSWVIEKILPRKSEFCRADRRGRQQIIATNLDQVLITFAPEPAPSRDLAGAYLCACALLEIPAVLIVNKTDILDSYQENIIQLYQKWAIKNAIPVIETSTKQSKGINELQSQCGDKNSIFVGQSGAGKSSLVQTLLPDLSIRTAQLAKLTGKGAHTTTTTTLYALDMGGYVYDSPGVWEYGLWSIEATDLAHGFIEFRPYIGACRFSNCTHSHEPGCAIKMAAQDGSIEMWRWESYMRMLKHL